ncbi:MAG: hypothetical protein Q9M43_14355 [Sulfurimonas sp.]|nr:hypothetical protein [Sulfurimonas sp.]
MQQECTEMILDENGIIIGLDCILHRGLYTFEELSGKNFVDVFIENIDKKEVLECIDKSIDFKVYINYKRDISKLVCFEVKHHSKRQDHNVSLFGIESTLYKEKKIFHSIGNEAIQLRI